MNALRLALVAAGATLFAASDFGTSEAHAQMRLANWSVQVRTAQWSSVHKVLIDQGWESLMTTNYQAEAQDLHDFLEYLLKKDPVKLHQIMRDVYGISSNLEIIDVRIVRGFDWFGPPDTFDGWYRP